MKDIVIKKIDESFVELETSDDINHNIYVKYSEYMPRIPIFTCVSCEKMGWKVSRIQY